jgi:hypothetical protein
MIINRTKLFKELETLFQLRLKLEIRALEMRMDQTKLEMTKSIEAWQADVDAKIDKDQAKQETFRKEVKEHNALVEKFLDTQQKLIEALKK